MALTGKRAEIHDPTYKQLATLATIDRSFGDLTTILTSVSNNNSDMRKIIDGLSGGIGQAKTWVLSN